MLSLPFWLGFDAFFAGMTGRAHTIEFAILPLADRPEDFIILIK